MGMSTGITGNGGQHRGWMRRIAAAFHRHIRYRITASGYLFGVALVLVGVAAVASANNLLFLILAAMLATLLISGFVSRLGLAGLELELVLPEHIAARQRVTSRLRLRNLKWFPSFAITLSCQPGAAARIFDQEIVFPVISGRTTIEVDAPAAFPKRGLHRENLFLISTRFPFGFVERKAMVPIRSEVVIYPSLEESDMGEDLLAGLRGDLQLDQRGFGSDFYRLRPYEYRESARNLDWKSSAHTGELQVREFSREERSTVDIYFDLRYPDGDAFEAAVQTCAYLVWKLSGESARIRFRTQRDDLMFPDQSDLYEILRLLALIGSMPQAETPEADDEDPNLLFSIDPEAFVNAGWRPARIAPQPAA